MNEMLHSQAEMLGLISRTAVNCGIYYGQSNTGVCSFVCLPKQWLSDSRLLYSKCKVIVLNINYRWINIVISAELKYSIIFVDKLRVNVVDNNKSLRAGPIQHIAYNLT